jgi:hypothetical protein
MQYLQSPKNLRKEASQRKLTKKVSNGYERRLYVKTLRIGRSVRRYVRAVLVLLICWLVASFARDPSAILRAQAIWNNTALTMMSTLKVQSEKVDWIALEETIQEFQKSVVMAWASLLELTPSVWTPDSTSPEVSSETNNDNAHSFEESRQELSQPTFCQHIAPESAIGTTAATEALTCASDASYTSTRNFVETFDPTNESTRIPASAQARSRTIMSCDSEPASTEPITLQGAPDAQFGISIALSADGSILAVGAPFSNEFGSGSEAGWVGLYQLVGNSAHVLFEFSGNKAGLRVGQSLSISMSSPPILAIGGMGFVNVYPISQFLNGRRGSDEWVLAFDRFDADFIDEDYGSAISISGDGSRLAVGSPRTSNASQQRMGMVQVYLIGTGQIGLEIPGLDENDLFGSAVALSEDGTTVAIGALTGASGAGYVRIFHQSGHSWIQVGHTIQGLQPGDNLGRSLSISADGQTVAIGAFQAEAGAGAGYVQVYQFDGTTWTQVGKDIVGPHDGDRFGVSVALTPDASVLTIGANAHDSGVFIKNGLVQVYENQSGTWTKIGGDIVGNADNRNIGVGLAICSDGRTIAAGGPLSTATQDTNIGEVVIYDLR